MDVVLAFPRSDCAHPLQRVSASMNPSDKPEFSAASLIAAIAAHQDRGAFAALFSAVAPKVKAFLIRRAASPAAAEEMTQDVMLSVWRKAALFDPARGSGEAWIFTMARNAAIDSHRRELSRPLFELDPLAELEAPRGDRSFEDQEAADRVKAALAALSKEQYDVVRLSFFDDRPHTEISAQLGVPLGTVKSRLRLAMKRLRDLLDDIA
jgi:RNA polymerase sigma-70 factor (ECF subfamily)